MTSASDSRDHGREPSSTAGQGGAHPLPTAPVPTAPPVPGARATGPESLIVPAAAAGPASRVLLALNPRSGDRKRAEVVARAVRRVAERGGPPIEAIIPEADSPAELAERCRALVAASLRGEAPRLDAVGVVGGDGMVQLGVGLVAGTSIPLGIIPAGSGNDFARAAGLPRRRPVEALEVILRGLENPEASTRAIDAMRVRHHAPGMPSRVRWAANSVNIGFDAAVNRRANELTHLRGSIRYLAAIADLVPGFRAIPFRVSVDGGQSKIRSRGLIAVCNGSSIGGGVRIAPDADLADGLLDVVGVRPVRPRTIATFFPLALLGRHTRLPWVELRRVRTIDIGVPAGVPIYADGEPVGEGGRIEIAVVPATWRLLRGSGKVERFERRSPRL